MLGGVLLIIGIVVLIVWAIGKVAPTQPSQVQAPPPTAQDPGEILRLRFARGEITADEFTAAKQTLEIGR
ncbi:MAG TPA: SHOCT domain-containing protein [Candidatus Limnocylindrales bacterium]